MTSPRRPGRLTRVRAWLLALLTAVGLLVFGAGTASAHTLPDTGNRVRACAPETITAVGVSEHIAAGQGRGPPLSQPRIVVATGVAADAGAANFGPRSLGAAHQLRYESAPYHGLSRIGRKNAAPTNGQAVLDSSVSLNRTTTTRRLGVDPEANEIVVFDETSTGVFHGHVRSWEELDQSMQAVLRGAGLVDRRGNILGGQ